ncbi:site-specific integrase [Pelagibius litoralis]|uniref:Site-specific integrase n=1 Tax=Pelagibius litoralis TaxID=374515 RepID=A0A967F0G6_9PROT|nr:site-specific integrase [Pelagibius litoralis]NIA70748.1 site-specific integrase [Pelagibius litoralis]
MDGKSVSAASRGDQNRVSGLQVKTEGKKLWLKGTVRAGKKSRRIRESTGLDCRTRGARQLAESLRITREKEVLDELVHGSVPAVTFSTAAAGYLKTVPNLGKTDHDNVKALIKRFGGVVVSALSAEDINAFYDDRYPKHAASTIQRHQTSLRSILSHAQEQGWLALPPPYARPKTTIKKGKHANKMFLPGEGERIVDAADIRGQAILATLFVTGARVAQALYLPKESFILAPGRSRIFFPDSKNDNAYDRALHDYARQKIEAWLEERGDDDEPALFLTDKGLPYAPRRASGGQIRKLFNSARDKAVASLKAAGERDRARFLSSATPHWMRHNFANQVRAAGGDVKDVMDAGMWEDERIVIRHYFGDAPKRVEAMTRGLGFGSFVTGSKKKA